MELAAERQADESRHGDRPLDAESLAAKGDGGAVVDHRALSDDTVDSSPSGQFGVVAGSEWTPDSLPEEISSPAAIESDEHVLSSRSSHAHEEDSQPSPTPRSHPSTARSGPTASSQASAAEPAENGAGPVPESPAFKTWREATGEGDGVAYKIGPFVLLLMDEFCLQYGLASTSTTLHHELQLLGGAFPDADLWFDMYAQCKSILGNKKHTHPLASTTLERLVEFCVSPPARKAVFSLDVVSAHSSLHVCASPKRVSSGFSLMAAHQQIQSPIVRPSQRPSTIVKRDTGEELQPSQEATAGSLGPADTDERHHAQMSRQSPSPIQKQPIPAAKKKRKMKQLRSHSLVSVLSHSNHASNQPMAGTYGEPVLVEAHRTELHRDLTTTRLLEKELRHLRIEKILAAPIVPLQKRLGFHTLTIEEERTREKLQDPYANELIMEKFGFSRRQDCALCQFPFLQYNLPHRVSFRCIMDVYDHWGYVPPDRDAASKYKPPLCYDAVQVCRMCAQLVFQHAKQPELLRPLSRKHRKAKSLASLQSTTRTDDSDHRFCSDPYALPPLLGDDVYDHRDALHHVSYGRRGRVEPVERDGRGSAISEFPAKAIIYSQQLDGSPFMSAKEWGVISPEKSETRHRIEATLIHALARPHGLSNHEM